MSKTLVIVGHPDLENGSIANKLIVEQLAQQEDIEIRDLIRLYPDFRIDVETEQQALLEADTVVLQFPFFWYSVPAILKHWLDQVFCYGFAYGSTGDKLHSKRLIISTTIGGPEESYQSNGYNSFSIDQLLAPLKQTANLTGMIFEPLVSHSMVYIPGVYNVKEEVEERAREHARRLVASINSPNRMKEELADAAV
ncbi:MAG: flavodoxin family protein [Deltaproteobacteria bacterium]|nr:MAG: flavodoxin family protein [Deltaproteobacteria bacterium]